MSQQNIFERKMYIYDVKWYTALGVSIEMQRMQFVQRVWGGVSAVMDSCVLQAYIVPGIGPFICKIVYLLSTLYPVVVYSGLYETGGLK